MVIIMDYLKTLSYYIIINIIIIIVPIVFRCNLQQLYITYRIVSFFNILYYINQFSNNYAYFILCDLEVAKQSSHLPKIRHNLLPNMCFSNVHKLQSNLTLELNYIYTNNNEIKSKFTIIKMKILKQIRYCPIQLIFSWCKVLHL